MKTERFYFSHDYTCITDPKIQALIGKYGTSGYGLFWRIVEMLHEAPEHKLELKNYVLHAIASTFNEVPEKIESMLNYMIDICELFEREENFIISQRVLNNINKRNKIREARSKAGKRSAEVRSANVKQKATKSNKEKESKEKESKNININYDDLLSYFNQVFKKNNRVFNSSNKLKYKTRLKEGYTIQNIRLAMFRASQDSFHLDNSYKYCTLEYFSRSATIDKFGFKNQNKTYIPTK